MRARKSNSSKTAFIKKHRAFVRCFSATAKEEEQMLIGAQGYTIREFAKDEVGIAKSLKKLKEIGFHALQVSAFGEIDRTRLREIADENGLSILITHTPPDRIVSDTDAVIHEHKILGCSHVGIGMMPAKYRGSGIAGVRAFLADFDPAAKKLKAQGLKLHYHNHAFEFARHEGRTLLEIMAAETDPARWGFIVDVYWVQYAGFNPAKVLELLRGRVDVCHLKDMEIVNVGDRAEQRMAPVMAGNLDWPSILKACADTGIPYAMIEQDDAYGRDPFDELQISYQNLKKAGMAF
jgi:sugar phosphate isomerase/epimerase